MFLPDYAEITGRGGFGQPKPLPSETVCSHCGRKYSPYHIEGTPENHRVTFIDKCPRYSCGFPNPRPRNNQGEIIKAPLIR